MKKIYLGAGCFWGTQGYFDKVKGIINTEVGYANGPSEDTNYNKVSNGIGHAEVIKIEYEESVINAKSIFDLYINIIDPYSKNRQGNDSGVQYRTCIYSKDANLLKEYQMLLMLWEMQNKKSQIEVQELINYTSAEAEHQKYLEKNPKGYCHIDINSVPEIHKK